MIGSIFLGDEALKSLRTRFERFCYNNRYKGIPNLMLYVAIGTFLVTLLNAFGYSQIMNLLSFNYSAILKGQVWRLVTFVFTMPADVFSALIMLYCFYSLGRAVESYMGTFKFNLYFFSGVLLMDIFGMAFGGFTYFGGQWLITDCSVLFAGNMAFMLYLSLILCFSTLSPDSQFLLFFIIPIKAWIMSLFYFIYIAYVMINSALHGLGFPQYLFPLVGLANYFLFFGKDVVNLLPLSWRIRRKPKAKKKTGTVPFSPTGTQKSPKASYTHRCTVCGRTDAEHPGLEFRYCSRCNGYFCYCQDHISNHTHVE